MQIFADQIKQARVTALPAIFSLRLPKKGRQKEKFTATRYIHVATVLPCMMEATRYGISFRVDLYYYTSPLFPHMQDTICLHEDIK
jgi:hypothetical protein